MREKSIIAFIICVLLICPSTIFGAIINVPSTEYPTIQAGMDAAKDGDTVLVADGTYTGEGNRNLSLSMSGVVVTVKSANGPENCVIDVEGHEYGFIINKEVDLVVEGVTIRNASNAGLSIIAGGPLPPFPFPSIEIRNCVVTGCGSGVYVQLGGKATITNCTITNNETGIYKCYGRYCYAQVEIANCSITNNGTGISGGGKATGCLIANNGTGVDSGGYMTSCIIRDNSNYGVRLHGYAGIHTSISKCIIYGNGGGIAHYKTGGIRCHNVELTISNSIITENLTSGGISAMIPCIHYPDEQTFVIIRNSTVANNSTSTGNGGGVDLEDGVNCEITNSIIWGNSPAQFYSPSPSLVNVTFSDIQGGYPGTGNINAYPVFREITDYHLTGLSPCIDKGTNDAPALPDTDFEGDPRIIDGDNNGTATVDMGADEYALKCEGNFDHDGDVDGSDLAIFAADFGRTDCDAGEECEGDFDFDNDVDGSDLAVFAADFGRTDCMP